MTETLVMWILIAIVQGQGATGGAFGSHGACEEMKAEFVVRNDVVFLSECTPVKVLPKEATATK